MNVRLFKSVFIITLYKLTFSNISVFRCSNSACGKVSKMVIEKSWTITGVLFHLRTTITFINIPFISFLFPFLYFFISFVSVCQTDCPSFWLYDLCSTFCLSFSLSLNIRHLLLFLYVYFVIVVLNLHLVSVSSSLFQFVFFILCPCFFSLSVCSSLSQSVSLSGSLSLCLSLFVSVSFEMVMG